jgi:hypothetical protein
MSTKNSSRHHAIHRSLRAVPLVLLLAATSAGAFDSYVLLNDTRALLADEAGQSIALQGDEALGWIRDDLRITQPPMPAYAID